MIVHQKQLFQSLFENVCLPVPRQLQSLKQVSKFISKLGILCNFSYNIVQWTVDLVVFLQHFCNSTWTMTKRKKRNLSQQHFPRPQFLYRLRTQRLDPNNSILVALQRSCWCLWLVVTCTRKSKTGRQPIRDATQISVEYLINVDFLESRLISTWSV